ncbi:glycosyltransferase family 2 protein [Calycomorphotria hydatis]|uniref:Undecaprenyl-phosphate 4-deoxy-4-formamido-L-arabinose transferase n=1 Tax=Calycomorphotria hydatis TaxID=2528027 RepID=A0A517T4T3_9PLAN|nr:glycosyltransferase family 2 protein [Calycomorphotria hydatis]QDT63361.1 Undecaprenyl-phosphate 4-deoxy-4-formamido-L-arabinose transferase [Calycomorphotria hydatis]
MYDADHRDGRSCDLSILVPVLNESESLPELFQEIRQSCEQASICFELILIDDGSTDGSWTCIEQLAKDDERVQGIRFRRNFGKAAALTAGMRQAQANRILMLDADLQDDPKEIPRFMATMDEGYDVVNGWKERRLDPWHKTYPSKVFNGMVGTLTGLRLHDHNCGFKLFTTEVANEIRIYGELHRFIAVLAHARGFKVAEIPVHHRSRVHGHSKYGMRRFLKGMLDLLTVAFLISFRQRPQHLMGALGFACFGIGAIGMTYLAFEWVLMNILGLLDPVPIGNRPLLMYSIAAVILGAQALSLGLLAELLVAYTTQDRDTYSIAAMTEHKSDEPERLAV